VRLQSWGKHPLGVQPRYLQTLVEIATEKNSTIIFPLPVGLVEAFLSGREKKKES